MQSKKEKPSDVVMKMWLMNYAALVQIAAEYQRMGDEQAAKEREADALELAKAIRTGLQ